MESSVAFADYFNVRSSAPDRRLEMEMGRAAPKVAAARPKAAVARPKAAETARSAT
jgi:hypothetical protein